MANIKAGNIKKGTYIKFRDQPHYVVSAKFVSPGKGSAFSKVRLQNLSTNAIFEFTFKSHDTVEQLDMESREMEFLYFDNQNVVFMDPRTYEQVEIPISMLENKLKMLAPEMHVYILFYNEKPLKVNLPPKVKLKVEKAEDAVAGDRQTAGKKPVVMETGLVVQAPLFVKPGDILLIDTETGEYVSRVVN